MTGRLPDFLIIGAAKAGTTALFGALSRHPRVYRSPVKEAFFFAYVDNPPHFAGPRAEHLSSRVITDFKSYTALFACPPGSLACDATPEYLYSPTAPAAALEHVPDARLIVILRHPVERGYSHYLHLRHEGLEPLTFEAAWAAEAGRIADGWPPVWHYRSRGFYGEQLRGWLDCFPDEQVLILFYEDWVKQQAQTLARVCNHLGLEPLDPSAVRRENVSSLKPRWTWLHHRTVEDNALRRWAGRRLPLPLRDPVTGSLGALNLRAGPTLDPGLRARLAVAFHGDLERLEALTGRGLTAWRS
jgi:hypothetical protein